MKIENCCGKEIHIDEEEIINELKKVYNAETQSYYIAGSLVIMLGDDEFDFTIGQYTEDIDYWLAKNYIKYKTESHTFWEKSQQIIKSYQKEKCNGMD